MIFSLARWFSSSDKKNDIEPNTRTRRQRKTKRKRQQNQSKNRQIDVDLTSDTSDYVDDDVEEDDSVDDYFEEMNNDSDGVEEDNKEFNDPDIDKVGGWVYGKDGAFPDHRPILNMWWKGKWENPLEIPTLTYEQIIGKGNKEKARELNQEQLDFLVHRWLWNLEHYKDYKKLRNLKDHELRHLKITINECHEMMTRQRTSRKKKRHFQQR